MWPFKKKNQEPIELKDYLNKTKKVVINGVIFHIKKINMDDHLSGLKVIMKFRDLYAKPGNKATTEESLEDLKKLKEFMKDIIYAGVVKPTLSMKKDPGDAIHIDEILNDLDLAQKLCMTILNLTYEKKSTPS